MTGRARPVKSRLLGGARLAARFLPQNEETDLSNLGDFLTENGLKADDVVARSRVIEAWSAEDRSLLVQRESARREKKKVLEVGLAKPKGLGRGVSLRAVEKAISGQKITPKGRQKIARAVNDALQSQKKDAVEWRVLFGDVGAQKGKKKKK